MCLTDDVIEATTLCLLAAAETAEQNQTHIKDDAELERVVLEEFGRCLHQIVQTAAL